MKGGRLSRLFRLDFISAGVRINHGNGNGRRASLWNDFGALGLVVAVSLLSHICLFANHQNSHKACLNHLKFLCYK